MSNSWESLKKRLGIALEPHGSVSEFCRVARLTRSSVDKWFDDRNPSIPSIEKLDRIAEGIGLKPWDAIKPESEPVQSVIPLQDHLEAMELQFKALEGMKLVLDRANALCQRQAKQLQELRADDPVTTTIVSILATFNEKERRGFLLELRNEKPGGSGIRVGEKKIK